MSEVVDRSVTGRIFEIQRFSIHDGPGIRTTVFLQGCPLRCQWCHNPEGLEAHPVLMFRPDKCIGCGYCFRICKQGAHRMEEAKSGVRSPESGRQKPEDSDQEIMQSGVGSLEPGGEGKDEEQFQRQEQEEGPLGPIFREYRGDARGAIRRLLREQAGEAPGALHHPAVGDIDLVWGQPGTGHGDGYGLSKVVRFHPEVLNDLQGILSDMKVVRRSTGRVQLESVRHKAAIRLEWDGRQKTWLLTAFEKEKSEPLTGERTDASGNLVSEASGPTPPLSDSLSDSVAKGGPEGNEEERFQSIKPGCIEIAGDRGPESGSQPWEGPNPKTGPSESHVRPAMHNLDREKCVRCGACAKECYSGAIELIGREASVEEVMAKVLRDKPFYETSGGGITLSGGEPFAQFAFTKALVETSKTEGLHTAIETSAYAPWDHIEEMAPLVDLFLVDLKHTDDARHRELTGVSNEPILNNIRRMIQSEWSLILRIPWIPGKNADEPFLNGLIEFLCSFDNPPQVQFMLYHRLGTGKWRALGCEPPISESFPNASAEDVKVWIDRLSDKGLKAFVSQ